MPEEKNSSEPLNQSASLTGNSDKADNASPLLPALITYIKSRIHQFRKDTTLSDKLQLLSFVVGICALLLVYFQLRENTKTNKVSIRGQLYQSEAEMAAEEAEDGEQDLTSIWAIVPHTVGRHEFSAALIDLVSDDPTAIKSKTARDLYHAMFDSLVFKDEGRRRGTKGLRKLFLYAQTNLYHVHNAFDYWKEGILTDSEWITWKNLIREMNAHPMLITVIWQGYRNRYFSRSFGEFLQKELCADSVPPGDPDPEGYRRGKDFISLFYPEMLKKSWPHALPDY